MRNFLALIMLTFTITAQAQVENLRQIENDSLSTATLEVLLNLYKEQQVRSICGIPFGTSRDEALSKLRNKFGPEDYTSDRTTASFKDIKYAGIDFDHVYFMFQSDGTNSHLYACIFAKTAKTKKEVSSHLELLNSVLAIKYTSAVKSTDDNGFIIFHGGISPLWDGDIKTLDISHFSAWHTDVIQYDKSIAEGLGIQYAARLVYGPYNFIKEEF